MPQSGTQIDDRSAQSSWLRTIAAGLSLLPLVLIAAVASGYALRLLDPPTLWLDEAMLFVNVRDIAWHELFHPLPFYDQTAPFAYIALLKIIASVVGLQETVLRLPSWLTLIATFALIARLPDTDRTTRILIAALIAGSFVTARIVTDAKPYMFELLFAFAIMIAFHPRASGLWTSTSFRLVLLGVAMLTTTAFPLVALAIGAPVVLISARADLANRRDLGQWRCLKPAAIFGAALAFYAAYFMAYLSPSLKLVAANHAYGFGPSGFAPNPAIYPSWFAARLADIIASHWLSLMPTIAIAAIAGGYLLARRQSIYAAQAGALLGVIIIANAAGSFPVMEERFSVFLLAWLALLAATGFAPVIATFTSSLARSIAVSGLTAALLMPAVNTLRDPFHQQARTGLAHIQEAAEIPLVTTVGGQPIIDAYLSEGRAKRSRCTVPMAAGTTTRCTAARNAADGRFDHAATKWYLMNYVAVASWGGSDYGFPGASLRDFSAVYFDWVAANLRRHKAAHLLLVQGNVHILAALRTRLRSNESLTRIVDERPPSPTLAHGAAQLFLFKAGPIARAPAKP